MATKMLYSTTILPSVSKTSPSVNWETARSVGKISPMAQGWRPYSATNQPISQAIHGNGSENSANRSSQRGLFSVRRATCQVAKANSTSMLKPAATIMRKLQNSGQTLGMDASTTTCNSASVGFIGSSAYTDNNRP